MVRGDTDFIRTGNCYISNSCPTTGCRGEDVTRTTEFSEHVPEIVDPEVSLETRVEKIEESIQDIMDAIEEIKNQL